MLSFAIIHCVRTSFCSAKTFILTLSPDIPALCEIYLIDVVSASEQFVPGYLPLCENDLRIHRYYIMRCSGREWSAIVRNTSWVVYSESDGFHLPGS